MSSTHADFYAFVSAWHSAQPGELDPEVQFTLELGWLMPHFFEYLAAREETKPYTTASIQHDDTHGNILTGLFQEFGEYLLTHVVPERETNADR